MNAPTPNPCGDGQKIMRQTNAIDKTSLLSFHIFYDEPLAKLRAGLD